ncbi:hypothetical protein [Burkholderia cepacia]|uniref:hypothetical protein n=1 Tax=Burkholderia cepacia TaxID=292 RepID=UPI000AE4934A|nr:hypothetical protein [Burkholderia cepacia]
MDEKEILDLSDRYVKSVVLPDGGVVFNKDDHMRLLSNGANFPNFSHSSLCAALAASVKTISPTKNIYYIHEDHLAMWSWSAQIVAHCDTEYFEMEEMDLKELVQAIVHTFKARNNTPEHPPRDQFPYTAEGSKEFASRRLAALKRVKLPSSIEQYLQFKTNIGSYLSFPLLEGILKKRCCDYVDYSGGVRKDFSVPGRSKCRNYVTGGRISSVGDLLHLYFDAVANEFERKYFGIIMDHLNSFSEDEHPFSMVYRWRNQTLHGEFSHVTVGGVLFSMAMLIAISSLGDRFEALRIKRKSLVEFAPPGTAPWIFYPPINR